MLSKRIDDPFKALGVTREDKMTFFLLKWVFNAIKLTSDKDDKHLKGKPYVLKIELSKQLSQNEELMHAFEFKSEKQLEKSLKKVRCVKEGCMVWCEYLDFFFVKDR